MHDLLDVTSHTDNTSHISTYEIWQTSAGTIHVGTFGKRLPYNQGKMDAPTSPTQAAMQCLHASLKHFVSQCFTAMCLNPQP